VPNSVLIAGGLGNNLFQLAAALFKFEIRDLELELLNSKSVSSLQDFEIETHAISVSRKKRLSLEQRVLNYSLRVSAKSEKSLVNLLRRVALKVLLSLLQKGTTFINFGIGYSSGLEKSRAKNVIGYFQTYRYASKRSVYHSLMSLEISNPTEIFRLVEGEVRLVKPVIVHIRRGDYLNSGFGLLGKEYYSEALKALDAPTHQEVWIFSDETDQTELLGLLPEKYNYRFILGIELSDSETFQIMRHGSAYVIANSTFSWWAAFLRYNIESPVVAPKDWFYNLTSPIHLVPNNWILVNSRFIREKDSR
jgi:hypothetical protein